MGVQIYDAWSNDAVRRIDHLSCVARYLTQCYDATIANPHIAPVAWHASAIDNCASTDHEIIFRHVRILPSLYVSSSLTIDAVSIASTMFVVQRDDAVNENKRGVPRSRAAPA